jgi:hypothetical protein
MANFTGDDALALAQKLGISVTRARRALAIGVEAERSQYEKLNPSQEILDKRRGARQKNCSHSWKWLSHEEQECSMCGDVRFIPDWD